MNTRKAQRRLRKPVHFLHTNNNKTQEKHTDLWWCGRVERAAVWSIIRVRIESRVVLHRREEEQTWASRTRTRRPDKTHCASRGTSICKEKIDCLTEQKPNRNKLWRKIHETNKRFMLLLCRNRTARQIMVLQCKKMVQKCIDVFGLATNNAHDGALAEHIVVTINYGGHLKKRAKTQDTWERPDAQTAKLPFRRTTTKHNQLRRETGDGT